MFPLRWWMPFAVFIPSYLLRLIGLATVFGPVEDMYMHVENAFYYTRYGLLGPDNWWTHPAKHIGLRFASVMLGNDILGWRMSGVIMGSVAVVVAALIARRLFRSAYPALLTAVLFALDPLSIAFSRTTFEDTIATCLTLCAILFWLRALEDDRTADWLLCGLSLGIAVACRQYAAIPGVLMLGVTLFVLRRERIGVIARTGLPVLGVAIISYYCWWLPWIARGNTMPDWWHLQYDSLHVQGANFQGFGPALMGMVDPQGWLFRWVGLVLRRPVDGREVVSMMSSDPVIWVFFAPAIAYLIYRSIVRRRPEWMMIGLSFIALYAFFVLANRPIMVYSALSIVPLGCLAVGYAVSRFGPKARWAVLAAAALWGLYLYPLAAGIAVPLQPYAWLLERVHTVGG